MKKIFSKEFVIGLCVILALVILFFGIDYLKGINLFQPANYYYATYNNVAGLEVASPVNIDGFKVGQVREINFNYEKPGEIKVLLALDQELRVPEDSKAVIEAGLLGGASINLELGSSDKMISVGENIPTGASGDLMSAVTNNIMPQVNSILPKVDSLMYHLNVLVANPALSTSITRLDEITGNIASVTNGLNKTVNSQVPLIMNNAGKITTNLDTITANLSELSAQLKSLPLTGTMDNVNSTVANLKEFSAQLNNSTSTLGKLMNDPELYNQLNRVAADIDSLIVDIKKNPKRYISIKLL